MGPFVCPNIFYNLYPEITDMLSPTTHEAHPTSSGLLDAHGGVFFAGFRDCTEEAVRYLIDVEQLTEEDPLIQGLRQHLIQHQHHIDISQILSDSDFESNISRNGSRSCSESEGIRSVDGMNDSGISCCLDKSGVEDNDQSMTRAEMEGPSTPVFLSRSVDLQNNVLLTPSCSSSSCTLTSTGCVQPTSNQPITAYPTQSSCTFSPHNHPESITELDQHFAYLVQNNSAVASLTEELFELLSEEVTCDGNDDDHSDHELMCIEYSSDQDELPSCETSQINQNN